MTVIGVAMVHNEEDVIESCVRHHLAECDEVIVTDHSSSDRTREILEAINDPRLHIQTETEPGYYQQTVVNRMADEAREKYGATWVIPFDADELWTCPSWPVRDLLPAIDAYQIRAGEYVHVPQAQDDPTEPNPFKRCGWRRDLVPNWKLAFRPANGRVLGFGAHFLNDSPEWEHIATHTLYVRHLPYRSLEQAKAKLRHGKAALEATDMSPVVGWHWREYGAWDDEQMSSWWANWTAPTGLTYDPLVDRATIPPTVHE
jgi:glycosyltransferase involved in cell wall biosynthesis